MLAASQSRPGQAVEHFQKTIEINSSYAEAYLNPSLQLSLPGFCRGAPGFPAGAGLPILLQEPDDNSLLGTGFSGPCGCMVDVPNVTPGSLQITNPRKGNPDTLTKPFDPDRAAAQPGPIRNQDPDRRTPVYSDHAAERTVGAQGDISCPKSVVVGLSLQRWARSECRFLLRPKR